MAILESSIGVQVESIFFPPSVKPFGATNTFFLGGAGVRGKTIEGTFVKVTGHGVYLEVKAISSLANKWKGKSVEELMDSDEFYRDIVIGKDFSEKVSQSCIEVWKSFGIYTEEADAKIIDEFLEIFKDQNFPPGSSFLFKILLDKSLMISFSKNGGIPEVAQAVIENGKLGETILEWMIGKLGVSPATKQSLAIRLFNLINPKANN